MSKTKMTEYYRVVRRVIACPIFEDVHERVADGAYQKGDERREQSGHSAAAEWHR